MKFLRDSLEETRKRMGVQRDAVECDYALSWILAGVRRIPSLKDTLVFRGAFRKCCFGDCRFSENLNFSVTEGGTHSDSMERAIREACDVAGRLPEAARDRRLASFCRLFRMLRFPGMVPAASSG